MMHRYNITVVNVLIATRLGMPGKTIISTIQDSLIVVHVIQLMHLPSIMQDNALNAIQSIVGLVGFLTIVVKRIVSPVIQMMHHRIIILDNVRIAMILKADGLTLILTIVG